MYLRKLIQRGESQYWLSKNATTGLNMYCKISHLGLRLRFQYFLNFHAFNILPKILNLVCKYILFGLLRGVTKTGLAESCFQI